MINDTKLKKFGFSWFDKNRKQDNEILSEQLAKHSHGSIGSFKIGPDFCDYIRVKFMPYRTSAAISHQIGRISNALNCQWYKGDMISNGTEFPLKRINNIRHHAHCVNLLNPQSNIPVILTSTHPINILTGSSHSTNKPSKKPPVEHNNKIYVFELYKEKSRTLYLFKSLFKKLKNTVSFIKRFIGGWDNNTWVNVTQKNKDTY